MSVLVTFVITDDLIPAVDAAPLEDVVIRVYDEAGMTLITEVLTDVNGTVSTLLDDLTSYWVRFFKIGYAFDSRLRIAVDSGASSNEFSVVGRDLSEHPSATDPNLCRVSGLVLSVSGAPVAGVTMYFLRTEKPTVMGRSIVIPSKVYVRSDADGFIEVDLIRNGAYDFWVEGFDDTLNFRVKVPDYGSADITDLAWPYVASVIFTPNTLTLAPTEEAQIQPEILLSSRVSVPYAMDGMETVGLGRWYNLSMSDPSVASYQVDETGMFTITGCAAGTTQIVFTPISGSVAERQPAPVTDIQTLTVTVT